MLNKLIVSLGERTYPIYITSDYSHLFVVFSNARITGKILIVTDDHVERAQAEEVRAVLDRSKLEYLMHVIPAGEKSKTLETVRGIYDVMITNQFDRNSCIVALGGGVVGDISGFAASTFLRGIHFVQVPTSLLAQVDSSVGGKVGVDYNEHKNIIGNFYQPKLVYINVNSLKTLPKRELIAGLGEVVKHGLIKSPDLLDYVEYNRQKIFDIDASVMQYLVKENCTIKAQVIEVDEKEESGKRAILNFGHTIGHAIESAHEFKLLHGECVAIGMVGALEIASALDMITKEKVFIIKKLFQNLGLKTSYNDADPEEVIKHLFYDKKIKDNKIYFVLPKESGEVYYMPVEDMDLIRKVVVGLRSEN